jgi:choline dehydrogenase-like flavoprotein
VPESYDIIIIGSGAGGGTIARELATTGAKILIIERGDFIPGEDANWSPTAVWRDLRYRAREIWLDETGSSFRPYTHYCVGGNTKFWGSVLYRLRQQDFVATTHADGESPAWPITYETLAPYYDRAEIMYDVRGALGDDPTEPPHGTPYPFPAVKHSAVIARIVQQLKRQGLHPSPLPLGLQRDCILCNTCNSFACKLHAKSDAEVCGFRPISKRSNVTLWTNTKVDRLLTDPSGTRVEGVEVSPVSVRRVLAPLVIVACGAVNSAALLLKSATDKHPNGLANSSGLVGRRYMAHLATMMQGFHPFQKNDAVFQKTLAINDFYLRGPDTPYPLGQIQSQGRTHGVMAQTAADDWLRQRGYKFRSPFPLWAFNAWVARGVDWLAMTEDLPHPDNRVTVERDKIRLSYVPNNLTAHRRLVDETLKILKKLGFWLVVTHSHLAKNTTHQCGTLVFGSDPATSVLDPFCRAHDLENLFVVDASFFPSSGAVNPGLTIAAQAIRVADHIKSTAL